MIRSVYEELEIQVREEKEKMVAQEQVHAGKSNPFPPEQKR